MISLQLFEKKERKLIHLVSLWNVTEGFATKYEELFKSNPHELAQLIGQKTSYHEWQMFLGDSRIQDYIDKIVYTQCGIIINKLMDEKATLKMADTTKLNSAIKYRDDHKPSFAIPVQYIFVATPLTPDEREFLPDIPENKRVGI